MIISNAVGTVTSSVVQRVPPTFHFVDAAGSNPTPPYLDWATAATNIQDAIDIALPGEIVLVTNGLYSSGGRVMAGDLTNRVALIKAITVASVNGPGATIIQGNANLAEVVGPWAVRCAWLTNGSTLAGFTLRYGGTRTNGDQLALQSGGGAWAASTNALMANCIIRDNVAAYAGGGCYQGTLKQCQNVENTAFSYGGGCYQTTLQSSFVGANTANTGGGMYSSTAINCTFSGNHADIQGGGAFSSVARNCIF